MRAGLKGSDATARQKTLKLVAGGRQLEALLRILAALGCRPEWAPAAAAATASAAPPSAAGHASGASAATRRASLVAPAASFAPTPAPPSAPHGGFGAGSFGGPMATPAPSLLDPLAGGKAAPGGGEAVGGAWVPRNSIVRDALQDLSNYPSTVRSSRQRTRRCTGAGGAPPGTAQR